MSATTEHLLMKAHREMLSHAIEWITAPSSPAAAADLSIMDQKPNIIERRAAARIFDEMNDSMPDFSLDRFFNQLLEQIDDEHARAKLKPAAYTPEELNYWDDLKRASARFRPQPPSTAPAACIVCRGAGCATCSQTGLAEHMPGQPKEHSR